MRTVRLVAATLGLCSLMATFPVAAQNPFRKEPFTDVKASHANYTAIEYLREKNVLRGYLDGTFRPDTTITRAEFVAILTNPFFLSGERSNDCLVQHFGKDARGVFFFDVKRDSEAAQDICEAVVHGIVSGYPDGSFKPTAKISFVEAAKISASVLSLKVQNEDINDVKWYVPYVKRLAELKAIPTPIRRFDHALTRGQMAEILFRLKTNNTTKASTTYAELR